MIARLATAARLLLAVSFLLNGVNWWWKLMPFPTLGDAPSPHNPAFVQAMINTRFLFDGVKLVEVLAGAALATNLYVPLALAVAFPVSVGVWAVDLGLLGSSLRAQVMGWSVMLLNSFLLLAYFENYALLFKMRSAPGRYWQAGR